MNNEPKPSQSSRNLKAYTTPKLVVYGAVRNLTAGGTLNMDEDTMGMSTNMV